MNIEQIEGYNIPRVIHINEYVTVIVHKKANKPTIVNIHNIRNGDKHITLYGDTLKKIMKFLR